VLTATEAQHNLPAASLLPGISLASRTPISLATRIYHHKLWGLSGLKLKGLLSSSASPCINADSDTNIFFCFLSEVHRWPEGSQQPGGVAYPRGAADAVSCVSPPAPTLCQQPWHAGPKTQPRSSAMGFKARS